MTNETKSENLLADLGQFTGSENWYRHTLSGMLYTDGVKYLAEKVGAFWLIDLVASHQAHITRKGCESFQVWRISRDPAELARLGIPKNGAMIEAWTDTPYERGSKLLAHQGVEYTDFPLDLFDWYVVDGVMMLKSEY